MLVFGEYDIFDPVQIVLDAPVLSQMSCYLLSGEHSAAQYANSFVDLVHGAIFATASTGSVQHTNGSDGVPMVGASELWQ
jgi:hypothetical protein